MSLRTHPYELGRIQKVLALPCPLSRDHVSDTCGRQRASRCRSPIGCMERAWEEGFVRFAPGPKVLLMQSLFCTFTLGRGCAATDKYPPRENCAYWPQEGFISAEMTRMAFVSVMDGRKR